jgi:hypothetical protein
MLNAASASDFLKLFKRADAFRRAERFRLFLQAAKLVRPELRTEKFDQALDAAAAVDAGEIARRASAPAAISALLDQAREEAIAAAL